MKKKYRLLKKSDFDQVFKARKTFGTEIVIKTTNLICLSLPIYLGREKLKNIKIGIVVPKKKWKRAVDRNYLRRIFWSANSQSKLDKLPKTYVVFCFTHFFHSRYKYKKIDFKRLKKEIDKIYSIFKKKCS